jgi:hypothetical protein
MAGRWLFCKQCREWFARMPDEPSGEGRRRHADEHRAETVMFDRLDMVELDVFLNEMYGGLL